MDQNLKYKMARCWLLSHLRKEMDMWAIKETNWARKLWSLIIESGVTHKLHQGQSSTNQTDAESGRVVLRIFKNKKPRFLTEYGKPVGFVSKEEAGGQSLK